MLRTAFSLLSARAVNGLSGQSINKNIATSLMRSITPCSAVNFSTLTQKSTIQITVPMLPSVGFVRKDLLQATILPQGQIRTVTKFSWKQGTRKTVRVVLHKFYRLNCGNWIRTIAGRFKKSWKKKQKRRRKHLEHVFCNSTQSRMLDKMVSKYWRKPKYYIKSPYEPYEWRENFHITRTKPWRPEGVDYE